MQTCTLNGTWQLSAGHRSLESVDMQIPGALYFPGFLPPEK